MSSLDNFWEQPGIEGKKEEVIKELYINNDDGYLTELFSQFGSKIYDACDEICDRVELESCLDKSDKNKLINALKDYGDIIIHEYAR